MTKNRCGWASNDPLYIAYHDDDWGVPVHDERKLFEMLCLEGAQAGLSWITILKRRENYRNAFDNFDVLKVAAYNETKIAALLQDTGIIRNRLKINSFIKNAQAFLKVQEEFGSFDTYIWEFVGGKPIQNSWATLTDVPAFTEESTLMSKALKKRGFSFVGPTICYAYMQSCGLVNDHVTTCFRHNEVKAIQP
jgi:DNA-3-methyladenine glycosylase I